MQFGICAPIDQAGFARAAGWDYLEVNAQTVLQGLVPDGQWNGEDTVIHSALPVIAANSMLPASLKVTGPDVDPEALKSYMAVILRRARLTGIKTVVFGAAGARNVPGGFDRDAAGKQIVRFARSAAELAKSEGVTIVVEHLHKAESNIINSLPEAMTVVRAVEHPNFQCLVDSFHFWTEQEKLSDLKAAGPSIRHVHLADKDGRVAPGESGKSDYRPLFAVLKQGGYDGTMSVEAVGFDIKEAGFRVLRFLRDQWEQA